MRIFLFSLLIFIFPLNSPAQQATSCQEEDKFIECEAESLYWVPTKVRDAEVKVIGHKPNESVLIYLYTSAERSLFENEIEVISHIGNQNYLFRGKEVQQFQRGDKVIEEVFFTINSQSIRAKIVKDNRFHVKINGMEFHISVTVAEIELIQQLFAE